MAITISDPVSSVVSSVVSLGTSLIDRIFPDPQQAAAAKLQILQLQQTGALQELASQAGIVQAEASSTNPLTSAWRPIMMLSFVAIIVNNYMIYPYLRLFWHDAPVLPLPPDMWDLLKIGVGGYVIGRSVEKTADTITSSKNGAK